MKRLLILTAFTLPVLCLFVLPNGTVSAEEDLESTLVTINKSLWEGWKNRDAEPFKVHLADSSMVITAQGMTSGKAQVINDMVSESCDVRNYSLSDMEVHRITSDTALLSYKASQDATCDGNKISARVLVSSVYVNRDGKWMAVCYHESPVAD